MKCLCYYSLAITTRESRASYIYAKKRQKRSACLTKDMKIRSKSWLCHNKWRFTDQGLKWTTDDTTEFIFRFMSRWAENEIKNQQVFAKFLFFCFSRRKLFWQPIKTAEIKYNQFGKKKVKTLHPVHFVITSCHFEPCVMPLRSYNTSHQSPFNTASLSSLWNNYR